jgi:predicted transcriptional regulator of viral defense system
MNKLSGLGKLDRKQLSAVIRGTKGSISVSEAAAILQITNAQASMKLSRWAKNGWLARVKRGIYIPVPLESRDADVPLEDPWIIAERLYSPCYIGGWSALEYWDLTEQIFRTTFVMTIRKIRKTAPEIQGAQFQIRNVKKKALFGLKPVWRGQIKVMVSDPSRTLIDLLIDPSLGGGLRPIVDVMRNYLKSEYRNKDLLLEYAQKIKKGVVYKRLGLLMEKLAPDEQSFMNVCQNKMSKGYSKLDPQLPADNLITKWRLWVPENWKEK